MNVERRYLVSSTRMDSVPTRPIEYVVTLVEEWSHREIKLTVTRSDEIEFFRSAITVGCVVDAVISFKVGEKTREGIAKRLAEMEEEIRRLKALL